MKYFFIAVFIIIIIGMVYVWSQSDSSVVVAKTGDSATVTYVGRLVDGTIFDESAKHGDGTFTFTLGAGQVIRGWDEGVPGMKVGEKRTLTIPPEKAYGATGMPGTAIGPNATLTFDITLLKINSQ